MLARWLPKMFNDDVITHGPVPAAPHPATAALNPALFAAAPPASSRLPLQRDDSMDSTSSTDSSSTAVSGASPAAYELSQSLGSSTSSNAASVSSSSSQMPAHNVVYGFEIASKQQKPEVTAAADGSYGAAVAHTAAAPAAVAVADKVTVASADMAVIGMDVENSIKAVYPTATPAAATPATVAPEATTPAADYVPSTVKNNRPVPARTTSLPIPGQQQKQQMALSSNSITTQILVANGYGKPRVVKLGGNSSSSTNPPVGPASAAVPPPAADTGAGTHRAVATAAKDDQRVCCGGSADGNNGTTAGSLKRRRGMFETFQLPGGADAAVKIRLGVQGSKQGLGSSQGSELDSVVDFDPKSTEVKGLAAVVAEYKDTVLRVGANPKQETRVVSGRRVVRLCSSPGRVIQGFVREGARAA